jgi:hypothetical protein
MSKVLYDKIIAMGVKYEIADGGWMKLTGAGWQSEKERQHRITVKVVIDKYSKDIEFTVFRVLEGRGFELVLGKPWLRLHNLRHNIDVKLLYLL